MSMNTVSVDREFLEHCLSVMRGVGELCQPIPRKSEDDPTEHCGGQALAELANCHNKLQETIAYAEQAALTQPEQTEAGRIAELRYRVKRALGGDLYALLTDIQNGIDAPGHKDMANSAIQRIGALLTILEGDEV